VTVSKSTHINKLNNHLTPQINQHIKKPQYGVGNSGPALGQAQKGGMVNFTLFLSRNLIKVPKAKEKSRFFLYSIRLKTVNLKNSNLAKNCQF
jgi:hypothetical protein